VSNGLADKLGWWLAEYVRAIAIHAFKDALSVDHPGAGWRLFEQQPGEMVRFRH
jgi:hypothetical protein